MAQLTDTQIDKVVAGCEHQAVGRTVAILDRRRDDVLVGLLDALQKCSAKIPARSRRFGGTHLMHILSTRVAPEWVDYNGHMNDAEYARVFSLAVDALMAHIDQTTIMNAQAVARVMRC